MNVRPLAPAPPGVGRESVWGTDVTAHAAERPANVRRPARNAHALWKTSGIPRAPRPRRHVVRTPPRRPRATAERGPRFRRAIAAAPQARRVPLIGPRAGAVWPRLEDRVDAVPDPEAVIASVHADPATVELC